jgi:high affinity Mn2+ porin
VLQLLFRLWILRRLGAGLVCALLTALPATAQMPDQAPNAETKKDASEKPETKPEDKDKEKAKDEWYSIHAQATVIGQGNFPFTSPYFGPNSLLPNLNYRTTETATLFLDRRLWRGAELVFDPEISGGRGLSSTLGMAGFPNGEATRVGAVAPTPYIARLFLRQTIGLDGDQERVEVGPNQLAGWRDMDRVTVSIGKMSALDLFDDNKYSHDPRTQFMNWSLMDNGAWDYPANTRGYTYGMMIEVNTRYLGFNYGFFTEPAEANGAAMDPNVLQAWGQAWEFEQRYTLGDRPGSIRELAFLNHAHMGSYRESLALMPVAPDITATRAYRFKYGFGLNLDQELLPNFGAFMRLGWNDGQTESWAFTEIDRTISFGLSLKGAMWRRPKDELAVALVANGLSDAHRDYLAAGGLGFIIGDGALNYGPERIVEMYYNFELREGMNVSFDLQGVNHPAYNRDRGPVAIMGIRCHMAY